VLSALQAQLLLNDRQLACKTGAAADSNGSSKAKISNQRLSAAVVAALQAQLQFDAACLQDKDWSNSSISSRGRFISAAPIQAVAAERSVQEDSVSVLVFLALLTYRVSLPAVTMCSSRHRQLLQQHRGHLQALK
jgi:hypothetical protein